MTKNNHSSADKVWGITRISLGLVFLWAFLDKTFGLNYATCRVRENGQLTEKFGDFMCKNAWIKDGAPTKGFLSGASGPFGDMFNSMAGNAFCDWLFMIGLLGIGVALVLGIGMRIAAYSGALLMILMWMALLPLDNHPFMDDHIVYALVLIGLWRVNDAQVFGFGKPWAKTQLVNRYPILK